MTLGTVRIAALVVGSGGSAASVTGPAYDPPRSPDVIRAPVRPAHRVGGLPHAHDLHPHHRRRAARPVRLARRPLRGVPVDQPAAARAHARGADRSRSTTGSTCPPTLAEHLMHVSHLIGRAQQEAFSPARIGLIIAGFEVPHAHVHVLPDPRHGRPRLRQRRRHGRRRRAGPGSPRPSARPCGPTATTSSSPSAEPGRSSTASACICHHGSDRHRAGRGDDREWWTCGTCVERDGRPSVVVALIALVAMTTACQNWSQFLGSPGLTGDAPAVRRRISRGQRVDAGAGLLGRARSADTMSGQSAPTVSGGKLSTSPPDCGWSSPTRSADRLHRDRRSCASRCGPPISLAVRSASSSQPLVAGRHGCSCHEHPAHRARAACSCSTPHGVDELRRDARRSACRCGPRS